MKNEMWTHENKQPTYRVGFRSGIQESINTLKELESDVKSDGKVSESLWISLCIEMLEDDLSMYVVGDEQ